MREHHKHNYPLGNAISVIAHCPKPANGDRVRSFLKQLPGWVLQRQLNVLINKKKVKSIFSFAEKGLLWCGPTITHEPCSLLQQISSHDIIFAKARKLDTEDRIKQQSRFNVIKLKHQFRLFKPTLADLGAAFEAVSVSQADVAALRTNHLIYKDVLTGDTIMTSQKKAIYSFTIHHKAQHVSLVVLE